MVDAFSTTDRREALTRVVSMVKSGASGLTVVARAPAQPSFPGPLRSHALPRLAAGASHEPGRDAPRCPASRPTRRLTSLPCTHICTRTHPHPQLADFLANVTRPATLFYSPTFWPNGAAGPGGASQQPPAVTVTGVTQLTFQWEVVLRMLLPEGAALAVVLESLEQKGFNCARRRRRRPRQRPAGDGFESALRPPCTR